LKWQLTNCNGETVVNSDKARFEANELNVVRRAAARGLGITLMPNIMLKEYFDRGSLVRILDDWSANPRDIYMLYNHKDHQPEKVRLLIDYVTQYKS
jgi:LysR family transcriptional regulator AphB